MDISLQDAMQRMTQTQDYAHFINYVAQRRNTYLEALSMTDASDTTSIAKLQGSIHALNEVIRIREDAANYKNTRTS